MKKLSDEELIRRISNAYKYEFVTEEEDIAELLSLLTKGRKAIELIENVRQHIPTGERLVPLTSIYDIVDLFKNYDKE